MSGALHVSPTAGMIATLVRGNQVVTIHKAGGRTFALKAICRACDRYGRKIRSLSSPETIFRDMDGTRAYTPSQRYDMFNDHGEPPQAEPPMPERNMLAQIGRKDLLA